MQSLSLQVVDLSGYSFTGKSAVYDLLQEFNGFYGHSKEFEFDLIRIQGGILDLKHALVTDWSPVRSSEAIRNFYRLIKLCGGTGTFQDRFTRTGSFYDRCFPNFTKHTTNWLDSLVQTSWLCEWPFPLFSKAKPNLAIAKILYKLGFNRQEIVYLSRLTEDQFNFHTRIYFRKLFEYFTHQGITSLILNNSFEPFNPQQSIILFDNAKSIIVDRDPRDIYLSALYAGKIEGSLVGKAVTGEHVNNFIERFRLYRINKSIADARILPIQFESLVLDYNSSIDKIRLFLEQPFHNSQSKEKIFNPKQSAKNIRQWKAITDLSLKRDVETIKIELADYCLNL